MGRNAESDGQNAHEIQVSYVCQYKKSDGTWYDFSNAEGYTQSDYYTTGAQLGPDNNPCTGSDGSAEPRLRSVPDPRSG